jgi:hypothetical protein
MADKPNPFKPGDRLIEDKEGKPPDILCPFIGNMMVPVVKRETIERVGAGSARPPMIAGMESRLFPCQLDLCMFWNAEKKTCGIKLGMDAIAKFMDRGEG